MANNEIRNPAKAYFKWKMPVIAKSEDDWNFWNTEDKYNRTMFIGYNDTTTPHVASLFLIVDGKAIQAVGDDVMARIARMEIDLSTQMAEIQQLITQANEQQQSINTLRTEVQMVLQNCSAFVDEAEIWAEGSDEDVAAYGGEHSAKGWALRAGEIISTGLPSEASFDKLSVTGTIPSNDMSTRVPNTEWVQNAIQAGGGGVSPDSDITCRSLTTTSGGASLTASYSAERSETTSVKVTPATNGTAGSIVLDARTSNWEYPAQISMTNTLMQAKVPGRMEITVGDTDSSSVDLSISTQPYVSTPWTHQLSCMLPIRANNGLYVKNRSTNESAFIATNTLDDDAETNPKLTVSGTLSVYGERTNMNGSKSSVTMLAHRAASDTDGSYVMLKAENSGSGLQSYLDVQEGETQIGTPKLTYFDKGDKTSSTEAIRLGKASEQAYSTQRYIYSELIGRFVNGLQIGLINDYEPDGVPFKVLRSNTTTSGNWLAAFGVTPTVPDIADGSDSSDKVPNTKWVQAAIAAGGGGGGTGAVSSVNGKTGEVVLSASDVGAASISDLASYVTTDAMNTELTNFATTASVDTKLADYQPKLIAGDGIAISESNVISATGGSGGGAVTSVNGNTGAVVLTGDNIMTTSDSATSLNTALAGKQASITADTELSCKSVTTSYDSALNSINYAGNISFTGDSGNGSLGKITANELFTNASGYYGTLIQASGIKCTSGAGGTTWFNVNSSDNTVSVDGIITAVSPVADANNNQVATTAWVKTAIASSGGGGGAVTSVNGNTGAVVLTADNVMLNYSSTTSINTALAGKQDSLTEASDLTVGSLTAGSADSGLCAGRYSIRFTSNGNDKLFVDATGPYVSNLTGGDLGPATGAFNWYINTTTDYNKFNVFNRYHVTNEETHEVITNDTSVLSIGGSPTDHSTWIDFTATYMSFKGNTNFGEDGMNHAMTFNGPSTFTKTATFHELTAGDGYEGSNFTCNTNAYLNYDNRIGWDSGRLRCARTDDDFLFDLNKSASAGNRLRFNDDITILSAMPETTDSSNIVPTTAWVQGVAAIKANINADNFSVAGKSVLSGLGMPSNRYINLTIGASGAAYTAPANGWFSAYCSTGQSSSCYLLNTTNTIHANGSVIDGLTDGRCCIPVKNGDVVSFFYNKINSSAGAFLHFIYAEGENNV